MSTWYSLLADAIAVVHLGFVLFVVLGQVAILIGWAAHWEATRNIWFRVVHLVAIGLVVLEAWMGMLCPLTVIESELRLRAGEQGYDQTFIGYWMDRFMYFEAPFWVFTLAYTTFGALVVVTFLAYPPRRRP